MKKILITGDDGYNSIGIRTLIHLLKNDYEIYIAGSKEQMSGIGGKVTMEGFSWKVSDVDGVKALVVNGTPSDSMELALSYFDGKKFDAVVSGINMGANLGAATFTSGTVAAALRALGIGLCKNAVAFNWDLSYEHWMKKHNGNEDLSEISEYPGRACVKLLELIFENNFWGAPLLNVNLPKEKSNKVKFTRPVSDLTLAYDYSISQNLTKKWYSYEGDRIDSPVLDDTFDTKALLAGFVSITPCKFDILNEQVYDNYKEKSFEL